MKYFLNDKPLEEAEYLAAMKEHDEWIKEEEKRVEALRSQEKKLDGKKTVARKNPQKIKC